MSVPRSDRDNGVAAGNMLTDICTPRNGRSGPHLISGSAENPRNMQSDDVLSAALTTCLTKKTLAGASETEIVGGFCQRLARAGVPLARTIVLVDTLHPIYEGRAFRWSRGTDQAQMLEYLALGRANPPRRGGVARSTTWSRPTNPCCAGASRTRLQPMTSPISQALPRCAAKE